MCVCLCVHIKFTFRSVRKNGENFNIVFIDIEQDMISYFFYFGSSKTKRMVLANPLYDLRDINNNKIKHRRKTSLPFTEARFLPHYVLLFMPFPQHILQPNTMTSNGHYDILNLRLLDCLSRLKSKNPSNASITGLCVQSIPVIFEFLSKYPSMRKVNPCAEYDTYPKISTQVSALCGFGLSLSH